LTKLELRRPPLQLKHLYRRIVSNHIGILCQEPFRTGRWPMIDDEELQSRLAELSGSESVEVEYILIFGINPFVRAGDFQVVHAV
jgi:hypothetical protein